MKKSILYLLFTFFTLGAMSQSIVLTPQQQPVVGSPDDYDLYTVITVKNSTDNALNLKASRQLVGTAPQGSSNYFCWDLCYPGNVSVSTGTVTLDANEANPTSFAVHFLPNGATTTSVIKYCVFDETNSVDSSCVNVTFTTESASISDIKNTQFGEFHPNPSSSLTFLEYDLKSGQEANVIISDMLGSVVFNETIINKEGTLSFDFSNQKSGLYFANIIVDGEVKTMKRLVITD